MSTAATTTEWELRLKEYVSAPFKKLIDYANGAQNKMAAVASGMDKAARASVGANREFKRNYSGLETTLHKLEDRQKAAFSTKHILAYQQLIDRTKNEMEKLNAVTAPPVQSLTRWQSLKNNLAGVASEIPGLSRGLALLGNPLILAAGGAIALGVGLKKSGSLAYDYSTGMAKVNATAQLADSTLGKLKSRLIDIGSHSGGNFELVPTAYEKILSQTSKVNLSLDILETTLKGSKAGFTDMDLVASALAQTISVVGEKNTTANEVMDTLIKAKAVGAGEFTDFANYLPQLIASGKNLSVGFKDTAGLFAYMTAKGQSATDSAMLLQNAFTALQKNEIIKGLKKKGIDLFNVDGSRKNIRDVFLLLSSTLDGLSDKKKTKFLIDIGLNDAQARNAFSVLTSDAEKFKDIMGEVNHAIGETDRQLAKTQNYARTWGDIGDELKSWGVAIGDYLLPVIDALVQGISGFVHDFKDLLSGDLFSRDAIAEQQKDIQEYRKKIAYEGANTLTQQKFGDKISWGDGSEANKFRDMTAEKFIRALNEKDSKNNIDKSESAAEKALRNVNKGSPAGAVSDSSKTGDSGGSVSDGNKVRSLTMHITMNNHLKADTTEGAQHTKRVIANLMVDAARDAMVTIGV